MNNKIFKEIEEMNTVNSIQKILEHRSLCVARLVKEVIA